MNDVQWMPGNELQYAGYNTPGRITGHCTTDGAAGLWPGDIDDLWKLGKPRSRGGPWLRTAIKAGEVSDPYLMTGYDRKTMKLSHDSSAPLQITIEVDYVANSS